MNKKRLSSNLMAWPEITAFCLELRKSFLRTKYGSIEDNMLTIKFFSEIVAKKEEEKQSCNFGDYKMSPLPLKNFVSTYIKFKH